MEKGKLWIRRLRVRRARKKTGTGEGTNDKQGNRTYSPSPLQKEDVSKGGEEGAKGGGKGSSTPGMSINGSSNHSGETSRSNLRPGCSVYVRTIPVEVRSCCCNSCFCRSDANVAEVTVDGTAKENASGRPAGPLSSGTDAMSRVHVT